MINTTKPVLSPADRQILESYKGVCDGLADYMGEGYELVLHSLEDFDHSVIKVINGYHSGRTVGSAISAPLIKMLDYIRSGQSRDYVSFYAENKKGEPVKCSAIVIRGSEGSAIGLLCVNLYLNTPFITIMKNYVPGADQRNNFDFSVLQENFPANADDIIGEMVREVSLQVMSDSEVSATNKNKEIIARLHARGVFKMKESVQRCADILGISKNTVYMHLRSANNP